MESMERFEAAESELTRRKALCAPEQAGRSDAAEASFPALIAAALFAVGIASFVVVERPATARTAETPIIPLPEAPAAPSFAPGLAPSRTLTEPQFEDALIPFTAFGRITNEGPLPSRPADRLPVVRPLWDRLAEDVPCLCETPRVTYGAAAQ